MIIAIPSKGRYEKATTPNVIKNGILFVPFSEVNKYIANYQNKVVGVPDNIKGITKTRNWILKNNHNENVLFLDDDVKECGYFDNKKRISLKDGKFSEIWECEFKKLFEVTIGLGFKLFGCENGGAVHSNHPLSPFSFKSIINGNLLGIVNDGTFYFDEQFDVKEDYDIMLRHYKKFGGILKAKYFYWRNKNWKGVGGCVDYRTDKMEEDCIKLLENRFPFMVQRNKRKNKHSILITWD